MGILIWRSPSILYGCVLLLAGAAACLADSASATQTGQSLEIFVIDTEGGSATLVVTPNRQAVLIDGGWNTASLRDSDRVLAVLRQEQIDQLEYVLVSHYHSDHLGGVVELASRLPIQQFLDRGPMEKPEAYVSGELYAKYMEISKGRRRTVKPGDRIELHASAGQPAVNFLVLAASGETIHSGVGTPNPACKNVTAGPSDSGENANSIAVRLEYAGFRYFDGGDLPWPQEEQLVCPVNQIGRVDVYHVDHHGKDTSNNPVLLSSIHVSAAVMNNGPSKGGDASVLAALQKVLPRPDIYQVHRNLKSAPTASADEQNIANPGPDDGGFGFRILVNASGKTYDVINQRTGEHRRYETTRASQSGQSTSLVR